MLNTFIGHGFYSGTSTQEGIPFYVVSSTLKQAIQAIYEQDPQLDISTIDQFDYVPVISKSITPANCNYLQVKAFVIRTRTDVFAEFTYATEQVDRVFRTFFVVALNHEEALSELTNFLANNNQLKNLTVVGMDKVLPEYKIFVHVTNVSFGE